MIDTMLFLDDVESVWRCENCIRFRELAKDCGKWWSVPVDDLVVRRPDNDLRYEEYMDIEHQAEDAD